MFVENAYSRLNLSKAEIVVNYIIQHADPETKIFNRTYAQIQKDTGASSATVARVFNALEENKTLLRHSPSGWFVTAIVDVFDDDETFCEEEGALYIECLA